MLANAFSVGNVYWFDPGLSQSSNAWAEIRKRLRRRSLRDQFPDLPPVTTQGCRNPGSSKQQILNAESVGNVHWFDPWLSQSSNAWAEIRKRLRRRSLRDQFPDLPPVTAQGCRNPGSSKQQILNAESVG